MEMQPHESRRECVILVDPFFNLAVDNFFKVGTGSMIVGETERI